MFKYALIPPGTKTVQTIVPGTGRYKHEQYETVQVKNGVACKAGDYYDAKTGLFYDDETCTTINGVSVETSSV